MKKKNIGILLASAVLSVGGLATLASCGGDKNNNNEKDPTPVVPEETITSISFEHEHYDVNNGDKITIKENAKGVKYSLQEAIEGITLNEETGEITFDDTRASYPDGILIATYKDLDPAFTTLSFVTHPALPTVTITNVSDYLVNGEYVTATSITPSNDELACTFSMKSIVPGIEIDAESGKVSFLETVEDGTEFTVVVESKTVKAEKTFKTLTKNIVYSDTEKFVLETTLREDATFKINFNGNTAGDAETTAETAGLMVNGKIVEDRTLFSYNAETKEITVKKALVDTLGIGEANISFLTMRNAVPLNLVIASNIIYDGAEFASIFGIDYTPYLADITQAPIFNEEALGGYYVLGDDVDLQDLYDTSEQFSHYGFLPIGFRAEDDNGVPYFELPFTGTFDGNGHTLKNFRLNYDDAHFWGGGMFGYNTGTIKNFTLEGTASAIKGWAGVICANNLGTIENIVSKVNIPGGGGLSATGLIGVNRNIARNIIQLHTDVAGDTNVRFKGGYVIGLNETAGQVENIYAIKSTSKEPPLKIVGTNNNSNEIKNAVLFDDLAALKEFDFTGKLSSDFNTPAGEIPALRNGFVPTNIARFKVTPAKQFGVKGDIIDLTAKIAPKAYEAELIPTITYDLPEGKGLAITEGKLDLTNLNVAAEGEELIIGAHVSYKEVTLDTTFTIKAYMEIKSINFTALPEQIVAGETYSLDLIADPDTEITSVTYNATNDGAGWRAGYAKGWTYVNTKERTVRVDDYFTKAAANLTIEASAFGKKVSKTVKVLGTTPLTAENTVLKYANEEGDYDLAIAGLNVKEAILDHKVLVKDAYGVADGTLSVKASNVTDKEVMHEVLINTEDGKTYKTYIGATAEVRHDAAWVAANDPEAIHIASVADFKNYFVTDGSPIGAKAGNLAKHYILDADLDFAGEKGLRPITANVPGNEADISFTGTLYGNGHTIKNYVIEYTAGSWCNGFFSHLAGKVYDLTLDSCKNIATGGNFSGMLAGIVDGTDCVIMNVHGVNCQVQNGDNGDIFSTEFTSGLVGRVWMAQAGMKHMNFNTYGGYNSHAIKYEK